MTDSNSDIVLKQFIQQQKKDRFWRNIRFFVWIAIVLIIFISIFSSLNSAVDPSAPDQAYVALIRMNGLIMPGNPFSAEKMVPALKKAFSDTNAKGVILDINSGGGSPVQSSIIYQNILALRKEYPDKKVVVVAEDMLASGAYMVAMGAPEIYVNQNTIAGSIGVVTEGFGFVDLMKKVGVTRRVFTAGNNKVRLDPFEPLNPMDKKKIQSVLDEVHQYFIGVVETSRGKRLHGDKKELFSGDFWTGIRAKQLGIVDHFGDVASVMKDVFHVKKYRDYSPQQPLFKSLFGNIGSHLSFNFGANAKGGLLQLT